MEDRNQVVARLAVLLKMPVGEQWRRSRRCPGFDPPGGCGALRWRTSPWWKSASSSRRGVIVEVEPQRTYPTSTFAAHLLGYVREVSDEQMKQGRYRRGDMIGQSGLERLLDEYLRGRDGGERIEVDALGRPVQIMRREEPDPGAQVITTIDRRIQEAAARSGRWSARRAR
jgi:penicillin-binding protein 2